MREQIQELQKTEDFKKVYRVFSGPPYNEKYTEEELEEIFMQYQQAGYVYGAYTQDGCVGLIALERGAKPEHPVNFDGEKVMYLADVAVLEEYRRKGVGNQLMLYGVMQSKQLGYDRLYMRTLERGSMSYGIAQRIGFQQVLGALQGVERERINGSVETMQNIFLEIDLRTLTKEDMKAGIQMADPKTEEMERE